MRIYVKNYIHRNIYTFVIKNEWPKGKKLSTLEVEKALQTCQKKLERWNY